MSLLDVQHIQKTYRTRLGSKGVTALQDVDFSVEPGEFIAIMGESGSGKTTLLNILAALDRADSGSVLIDGVDTQKMKESSLADYRREHLGFVFQDFNLLDTFTLEDNILLPLVLQGKKPSVMKQKLKPLAQALGIDHLLRKYPFELSGGQKQRGAVARALITEPTLVLADEPTGALDSRSSDELLDLFEAIHEKGQTILMVTHSMQAAAHASRVLFIRDGKIFHQIYRGEQDRNAFYDAISRSLSMAGAAR